MNLRSVLAAVFAAICMTGTSWAVSPANVGTYVGTVKSVATAGGIKTVTKETIQIEIAANEATTVTVNNVEQVVVIAAYNSKDVAIAYGVGGPIATTFVASLSFKGTTLKGTATGLVAVSAPTLVLASAVDVKYKLKKQ
jgi:hypothetical protein